MQVIILCGGMGTRLREETEFKPKPMVEIGGKPILWHIMNHYSSFGHKDFLLCTGYRGDMIKDYFMRYRELVSDVEINLATGKTRILDDRDSPDWNIRLQDTGIDTLTGSRIKAALKYLDDDLFLATYGDGVCDIDLDVLVDHHRAAGKLATITAVRPSSRFGELDLAGNRVHSFAEKPQTGEGWINGGFFVFDRSVFEDLPDRSDLTLEEHVLEVLAEQGQLNAYRHSGFWQCMDNYREMCLLQSYWEQGLGLWKS
jgi:glucose-1-phosphate cytidylyltransferase